VALWIARITKIKFDSAAPKTALPKRSLTLIIRPLQDFANLATEQA
jgi:hypothetical protein